MAIKKAEKWMLERFEMSDGLGAIYPAMLNAIIALRCLGYSLDDPQFIRAMDEFEKLGIDEPNGIRIIRNPPSACSRACLPVWDTAQAVYALGEAGVPRNDPRLLKAADWMLSKEVRHKGDWAVKVRKAQPGGWYFEFNNEFYPDVDDTAQVLLALNKVDNPPRTLSVRRVAARHRLDLLHAVQERRLGQLRQRQHEDDLRAHPLCRPQRHARSADRRHHRPHSGNARHLRLHAQGQARREAPSSSFTTSRSRTEAGSAAGA